LGDDCAFNVSLKRNIIQKSSYLSGSVKKSTVKAWLQYLMKQPLYKHYNITVDWFVFNRSMRDSAVPGTSATSDEQQLEAIEPLDANRAPESELIHARQHTMLWNECHCLDIAPGQRRIPENIIYDTHTEELSFPAIYFGVGRWIKDGVRTTPYTVCMSEICRSDRRGVTPQHALYMAMKILPIRVRDGIYNMLRCVRTTENITRRMIQDREYLERLVDTNLAFLKTIPISAQYWAVRKKDPFAMIRQTGNPTAFLTKKANETHWSGLLTDTASTVG
jgi:hypothetical protein